MVVRGALWRSGEKPGGYNSTVTSKSGKTVKESRDREGGLGTQSMWDKGINDTVTGLHYGGAHEKGKNLSRFFRNRGYKIDGGGKMNQGRAH